MNHRTIASIRFSAALIILPAILTSLVFAQTPTGYAKPFLFAYNFASGPDAGAWRVALVDFDGDGFADVCAVNVIDPGAVHVLKNVRGGKCAPLGEVARIGGAVTAIDVRRVGAKTEVLVARRSGAVARIVERKDDGSFIVRDDDPASTSAPTSAPASAPAVPAARMPASRPSAPEVVIPDGAVTATGDVTGDGISDLMIFRRDRVRRTGFDVMLAVGFDAKSADRDQDGLPDAAEAARKTDPLDRDTDHDGLTDGWEVHGEGVLDLPALGCSPTKKDVIVYVQRIGDPDGAACAADVHRAVKTWSELPAVNPDGSTGIAMHILWLPPLSAEAGAKPWWVNADENMPRRAKGLAHYLQVAPGGGGQSGELADAGGCGANALWATFLHEFGHQVGLSHSGGDLPGMCPIYTSLMNYAYSYGFDGDYEKIHYSTGALAGLELNEVKLGERLAFPLERIQFLGKGPFAFKLEKDGDGTKIDWNRNGTFDEAPVRADISDVYGADAGIRHTAAKTIFGASLVTHRERLWVFSVNRQKVLEARYAFREEGRFSEPVVFSNVVPTGDLWASSDGESVTLFVPTKDGVRTMRSIDVETLPGAKAHLIPESIGAGVSAFVAEGRVTALLWDGEGKPVRYAEPAEFGYAAPRVFSTITSVMTPAAVADLRTGEICFGYGSEKTVDKNVIRRWRMARGKRAPDGTFVVASDVAVGGEAAGWAGNSRPVLLIENAPTDPAPGRLHFIARGWTTKPDDNGCWYEAITIGDKTQSDGWRLRRFYDEWTTTRSPVGAAFYAGELALAYRWFGDVHGDDDENLQIAFHGFGVVDAVMKDFDDVTEITQVGLERSIPYRHPAEN